MAPKRSGKKKTAADFEGMDPAMMMALMKDIPANAVTGRKDISDIAKFMEENPARMKEFMTQFNAAGLGEKKVDLDAYDYKALAPKIVHESFWVLQLESMGFVDQAGNPVDPSKAHMPGVRPTFMIYCYDDHGAYRIMHECTGLPDSKTVLEALRQAIAEPIVPLKPCLPWFLMLAIKLAPHAPALKPFLDSLPAPFHWRIETPEEAQGVHDGIDGLNQKGNIEAMALVEKHKVAGNKAFSQKNRAAALEAYNRALSCIDDILSHKPSQEDEEKAKKLQAICYANRAATFMIPGEGIDAKRALEDGKSSEQADPSYGKGYIRQATANQLLGDIEEAQDAISRALHRKDLENDIGLTDRFIDLTTNGEGFSKDEETFKQWLLDIMINNRRSAARLSGLKGEWERRCNAHLQTFKRR